MKPTRSFTADVGDDSVGLGGPDAIENDIDQVTTMFNPQATHDNAESGGIGTENLQNNIIEEAHLKDDCTTDVKIGNRIIDDNIVEAVSSTGTITKLFSWIGKIIKNITGEISWSTAPADTIKGLDIRVNSNDTDIVNLQTTDTSLQVQITNNDTDITNLQNTDTGLQNQISTNDTDITNLQTKDNDLQTQINNIDTTIISHGLSIVGLDATTTTHTTDITTLQADKANISDVYTKNEINSIKHGENNIEDQAIKLNHLNEEVKQLLPESLVNAMVLDMDVNKMDKGGTWGDLKGI